MKTLFSTFQFLIRFFWFKKKLMQYSQKYMYQYCLYPIIEEIKDEKLCDEDYLNINFAIQSVPFKGILNYYLSPNKYFITSKDIAVALNMGLSGYTNKNFDYQKLIDISFFIIKKIRERLIYDKNLSYIINELGKDISSIQESNRKDIEKVFATRKNLFEAYFNIYSSNSYSEKITIFYPGENKTYIDWKKENSITVNTYSHDIPHGFFLIGFDYYRESWLKQAIRTKEKEYFNSENKNGKIIWQS